MPLTSRTLTLLAAGLFGLLAWTCDATAQVVAEPPALPEDPGKDPPTDEIRPQAVLQAGNAIYRIFVADDAALDCGAWTAATGPAHPATALPPIGRKNVLYNGEFADPGTSDTTLRSYDTGIYYRTGPNASRDPARDCRQLCLAALGAEFEEIVTPLPSGGSVRTGWRGTWTLRDGGSGRPIVEFVQEVNVEGPVDGTETVENSVIRETHRVRNLGPGVFRFGLRKHWDWQIAADDGPAMGDCENPEEACDRSLDLTPDGSLDGAYPGTYTINHDPAVMVCPPGIPPDEPGCGGNPLYLVAGTVAPPSALSPQPDPPDLLQFNNWNVVVNSCWRPGLVDAAPCGASGTFAGDDSTIAYFYGVDDARALALMPGDERSFTQYVVAARDGCPSIVEPPTLSCDAGGPYEQGCAGDFASVPLDGTGSSESGLEPLYSWSTNCPGGSFDDASSEDPTLTLETEGCVVECLVTLTVTDAQDPAASTSCSASVTVADLTPPEPACPTEPLVVECSDGGLHRSAPEVQAWLAQASAFDECSGEAVAVQDDLPAFVPRADCPTELVVTFTAVDACGNESSCQQLVQLVDETPPTVQCPPDRSFECGEPEDDQAAWRALASAMDDCEGPLPAVSELLEVDEPCPATRVETWLFSALDACGNEATCTATWAVGDTQPPMIAAPADAVLECGTPNAPSLEDWLAEASATDDCAGELPVDSELFEETRPCPGTLVQTWRFFAVDACGNPAEAFATWTVQDTIAPQVLGVPPDAVVECDAVPPPAMPTAQDLCDPAPSLALSEDTAPGACAGEFVITRTWTATDACGNETAAEQVLTVVDTTPPALEGVPEDAVVPCDEIPPPATPTATDACGPAGVELSVSEAPGGCPNERLVTRTWVATDDCGNEAIGTQVLTVVDEEPPLIEGVPADATVECDAVPPPASPTATDACGPASLSFDETESAGACPNERVLTRTWTAADECGLTAQAVQVLTVVDTTPPSLEGVPPDATVECDAVPPPASPTATDACGPAGVIFEETEAAGACPNERVLTRTWTAADECGNEAVGVQVLTVVDTQPPQIEGVPADATVECDAVPPPASPTATDACGSASLSFEESEEPGACPNERVLTRTWTATDECGNSAQAVQVLTVVDTMPPLLEGVPADATVECDAVPPPASPTASDACGPAELGFEELRTDGACPHEYRLARTWTATDECGLTAQATQVLTVVDTTPPLLEVPAPLVLECTGDGGVSRDDPRVQAWLALATADDACSGPLDPANDAPDSFPLGCPEPIEVPVSFTAVDECGHAASAVSSVTVVDSTPPVVESIDLPGCLWPPNHRYACFEDLAARVVATDDCGEVFVRFSGCASDQPDEAPEEGDRGGRELGNGDGRTFDDCVIAPDGGAACLRTERQGTDPSGRTYLLSVEVSDSCGNAVEIPWAVHVPHDQREHDCEKLDNRSLLKKQDPFPWER